MSVAKTQMTSCCKMKEFNFDDFLEFIKSENLRLANKFGFNSPKDMVLEGMTKMMEENGEFASEVLRNMNLHRRYEENNKEKLAYEFADCMIVLLAVGDRLGIDVKSAITEKVKIIEQRWGGNE